MIGILGHIKVLLKESAIYGASSVLSRFVSVFLVPLYTASLTPADYGVMGLLTSGYSFISIFLILNLDSATARWFYDTKNNKERLITINTWFYFYQTVSLVMCGVLFLLSEQISLWLLNSSEYYIFIRIIAFTLPLITFSSIVLIILRLERQPKAVLFFSLTQSILLVVLNCFFVLYLRIGLIGIYYSQFLVTIFSCIYALFLLKKWIASPDYFSLKRLIQMLRYALPFLPANIVGWFIGLSGLYFLNIYCTTTDVGIYQIGVSIASGVALFTTAFQMAWGPFSFSIMNNEDSSAIYASVNSFYIVVSAFICLCMGLFSPEILYLFTNEQYYDAAWIITILSYNHIFITLSQIAATGLALKKKTFYWGVIYLFSGILLLILNYIFIPLWGKEGAALASCLSQLMVPVLLYFISQKVYYIPYRFASPITLFLFFIMLMLLGRISTDEITFLALIFKLGLVIIALILVKFIFNKDIPLIFLWLKNSIKFK